MDRTDTTMLVRGARAGDPASLTGLIERFGPLLMAQARYRLAGNRDLTEPEDLVQEVWVRALPQLPELGADAVRQTPVVLKFLSAVLLHRVQELLRERIRQRRAGSDVPDLPAETLGVVSRCVRAERTGELWALLDSLSPAERELLVLRGIEQVENQAVAERLGETSNAVSLRYNRLLARLRERLRGSVLDEL